MTSIHLWYAALAQPRSSSCLLREALTKCLVHPEERVRKAATGALLQLGEHALELLARHKSLLVQALNFLPLLEANGLVALRLEVLEEPPRAQQPDRYAAALLVVGEELA